MFPSGRLYFALQDMLINKPGKKSWVIYVRCVEVQEIVYQCFRVNTPDLIEKLRSLSLDKAQNVHQWHVTVPSSSG